jgi:hypothetical protein
MAHEPARADKLGGQSLAACKPCGAFSELDLPRSEGRDAIPSRSGEVNAAMSAVPMPVRDTKASRVMPAPIVSWQIPELRWRYRGDFSPFINDRIAKGDLIRVCARHL